MFLGNRKFIWSHIINSTYYLVIFNNYLLKEKFIYNERTMGAVKWFNSATPTMGQTDIRPFRGDAMVRTQYQPSNQHSSLERLHECTLEEAIQKAHSAESSVKYLAGHSKMSTLGETRISLVSWGYESKENEENMTTKCNAWSLNGSGILKKEKKKPALMGISESNREISIDCILYNCIDVKFVGYGMVVWF